ncbi:TIGR02302 family protein [Roseovarius mucosus]|uniref:TIGR02302 family protein n=1 Tax=Roseovarius mucosus TaxID=215743 RepID=UPI0035CE891F
MAATENPLKVMTARLRRPLMLTWAGLIAEQLVRAFWPVWSVIALSAAALMLGLQDMAAFEVVWGAAMLAALVVLAFGVLGMAQFRFPRRAEALARLDEAMPGRPLAALGDVQAIGAGDAGSAALWQAHQARMAARAAQARAVEPDLRLSRQDPFGVRYIALLGLIVALLFGSVWRAGSVVQMVPGGGAAALASGPTWEGWIEPPAYTGLPSLYLADQGAVIEVPEGSRITLRFYGEVGALSLFETVSGGSTEAAITDPEQHFDVTRTGDLRIDGPGGRSWAVQALADAAPTVEVIERDARTAFDGQMSQPFGARDDYGVVSGGAVFTLDLAQVDRRHGLAVEPDARDPISLDLPMPLAGDRTEFTETLVENLSEHPWAHLPVTLRLQVADAAGQEGQSEPFQMGLPARRFFDPMAAAVIEQRRDLLWSRQNAPRVAQVLRAVSYKPEGRLFRSEKAYLRLRVIIRQLEAMTQSDGLDAAERDEIAQALWDLGVLLEDGDLGDALERMRAAQERLSEAMKNGASEEEIARLMQDLRDATQDYLRQKMQQAERENPEESDQRSAENMMQMNQQDLQDMMDRIQELMEQGRYAEAQQALEEFQQMMENMQVTQGQGQQGQSPGEQAMEGLAETLREQQGLSDQAFRDLQEQFNPGAQSGQSQNNEGRSGGEGRGESHDGQQGQGGQGGEQQGQGGEGREQAEGGEGGEGAEGSLAERQEALRQELERQRQGLPQLGGEAGEAARDALERAGRAMEGAEDALRNDDLAGAIDNQAEAMEALREGMRNMGEAMAEQQNPGGQGEAEGPPGQAQADPLGREAGQGRQVGTQDSLLQGEDVYRRARELLDEIRKRSGEGARPDVELDYLKRLLERF